MPFPHAKLTDPANLVTKAPVTFYNGASAATLTLTGTWPANGSKLSITLSGADCAGTLTINGTETITFTQAGKKTSTSALTARPTITTSGLNCTILITCLDSGLAPIMAETLTPIDIKFHDEQEYYSQAIGGFVKRPAQAITDETASLVNDVIQYNGVDYPIKAIHPKRDRLGIERRRVLQF